jgi:MFS family permease
MNRNLFLVALSLFTWGLGEGFFIYFQPLYLQQWGANSIEIGGILGAVGVVLALSQIPTGLLTDRFGPKILMWVSWILGAVAAWIMVFAPTLTVFVAGYLIYGLTGFGVIPINTYITNARGKMSVGRALTLVSGMYNLGAVMGPLLGGQIAERLGLHIVYVVAACIFVVSTVIILFTQTIKEIHPEDLHLKNPSRNGILRNPRFLLFLGMSFVTLVALYLPQPLTSNFLQNQQHLSDSTIGLLGAIGSLGNAFATLILGNIAPFWGMLVGQLWVALFATFFLLGNSPLWFGLGYFFFGGYRLYRSMTLAYARPMANNTQIGLLFGSLETAAAVAVIFAPVLAGLLYNQDPYLVYRVALIGVIAMICINLILMRIYFPRHQQEIQ